MDGMNKKLDEKFGKMSFDESLTIYEKINDGAESDFVNMLMAQNKDINKTEVCQKLVKFIFFMLALGGLYCLQSCIIFEFKYCAHY